MDLRATEQLRRCYSVLTGAEPLVAPRSYADLWTFAGKVAIEAMGGPTISWKEGRSDAADASACPPNGLLPDATQVRRWPSACLLGFPAWELHMRWRR